MKYRSDDNVEFSLKVELVVSVGCLRDLLLRQSGMSFRDILKNRNKLTKSPLTLEKRAQTLFVQVPS